MKTIQCIRWTAAAILATGMLALSVSAQQPPPPGLGPGGPGGRGPGGMGFLGFERGAGEGFPADGPAFTAQFTITSVQTLGGGTTIQHQSSGTMARDGQGRTYRLVTLPAIGPWAASGKAPQVVYITDRIAGFSYILDPSKMTYRQFPLRMPKGNRPPGNPPGPGGKNPPVTTPLPVLSINGVNFQGTSLTHTIPANQVGNSAALTDVFNRWYSSDYKLTGKTERIDARFGNTTFLITSLETSANPNLFSLAGYSPAPAPSGPRGRRGGPPPAP